MGERLENLLGALVLGLADSLSEAVESSAGHPGAMGAALAVLAAEPGLGIEQLRLPLARTQSATVRVVDQLVAEGYAVRQSGRDRRSVAVVLTGEGEAAAARVLAARRSVLGRAVGALRPAERRALSALLETMLAAITTGPVHAEQICRLCDVSVCPEDRCPVGLAGGSGGEGRHPAGSKRETT